MSRLALPQLEVANAHFVTPQLLVGGDLDYDTVTALRQLLELTDAGVTHIVDVRIEASDEELVAEFAKAVGVSIGYLHHGMDDAGQLVPAEWFETGVAYAVEAIHAGGIVLAHCHMGINRGPSLGYAVLFAQGWDAVEALDAIRQARPIAYIDYAADALAWHHARIESPATELRRDLERLDQWRRDNQLDVVDVIRKVRIEEARRGL